MLIIGVILSALFAVIPLESGNYTVQSAPIYFRWDKTTYDPTYLDNKASVDSVLALVHRIGEENVEKIHVVTYASPDGSGWYNANLSKKRAYELRWLFRTRLPNIPYYKITCGSAGEGWDLLRARVSEDTRLSSRTRERVLEILDNPSLTSEARKTRMAGTLGKDPSVGDVYQYLLRTHYRKLRFGEATVTITVKVEEAQEQPVEQPAEKPEEEPVEQTVEQTVEEPVAANSLIDSTVMTNIPPQTEGGDIAEVADNQQDERHPRNVSDCYPVLAASTNLIYDLTWVPGYGPTSIPSFSLEYYPAQGRFTFGADVEWPMWQHWNSQRFMQINNITLWSRRYFQRREARNEGSYKGVYLLANANLARYGLGWDQKGWEGEGMGASAGIGFKRMFGYSRFFFDVGLALGIFWSRYDPYVYGNEASGWYYYDYAGKPEDFTERNKRLLWFGPTRAYFSIGYELITRKKR